jgi:hypothetical protein
MRFLFDLLSFSRISILFFSEFLYLIVFLFHVLLCFVYFIQLFISVFLEFIQMFICVLFNFIDHFSHFHSLRFYSLDYPVCYYEVEFWRYHVDFFFSISLCFCIGICMSEHKSLVLSFNNLEYFC